MAGTRAYRHQCNRGLALTLTRVVTLAFAAAAATEVLLFLLVWHLNSSCWPATGVYLAVICLVGPLVWLW